MCLQKENLDKKWIYRHFSNSGDWSNWQWLIVTDNITLPKGGVYVPVGSRTQGVYRWLERKSAKHSTSFIISPECHWIEQSRYGIDYSITMFSIEYQYFCPTFLRTIRVKRVVFDTRHAVFPSFSVLYRMRWVRCPSCYTVQFLACYWLIFRIEIITNAYKSEA